MANPKVLAPGPSAPLWNEKTADASEGPRKAMPMSTHMKQVMACVAYGACSICITLFNKAVFAVYKFQFPNIVTLLQVSVSLLGGPPFFPRVFSGAAELLQLLLLLSPC